MAANVNILHVDCGMGAQGKVSKILESSQDCEQLIHKGEINDTSIGTNFAGESKPICPERNEGENEKVEENINDVFNKIYVSNMIRTCVDKLGTEHERGSCRKVVSLGDIMVNAPMKGTKKGDDEQRKDRNEVHLDLTMSMGKYFRC
jgi:hypothetical protein